MEDRESGPSACDGGHRTDRLITPLVQVAGNYCFGFFLICDMKLHATDLEHYF